MTGLAWALWAFVVVLASFAVLEGIALTDRKPNTTLSATWWRLRTRLRWAVALLLGALCWLTWHLFSPLDQGTGGVDDVLVILFGVACGWVLRYEPRDGA